MLNLNIPQFENLLHLITSLIYKLNLKMTQKYKHIVKMFIIILLVVREGRG